VMGAGPYTLTLGSNTRFTHGAGTVAVPVSLRYQSVYNLGNLTRRACDASGNCMVPFLFCGGLTDFNSCFPRQRGGAFRTGNVGNMPRVVAGSSQFIYAAASGGAPQVGDVYRIDNGLNTQEDVVVVGMLAAGPLTLSLLNPATPPHMNGAAVRTSQLTDAGQALLPFYTPIAINATNGQQIVAGAGVPGSNGAGALVA